MPRPKKNKGLDQAKEILEMFEKMPLKEKEAFLLGRISIALEVGNGLSDTFNAIIKDSDKALTKVREALYPKEEE